MAERSKAPDSRCYNLLQSMQIGGFWSTYVGVGSNPTSDISFLFFFFFSTFFIRFSFIFVAFLIFHLFLFHVSLNRQWWESFSANLFNAVLQIENCYSLSTQVQASKPWTKPEQRKGTFGTYEPSAEKMSH